MPKRKKWIYPRHTIVRKLLYIIFTPYTKLRYGIRISPRPKDDHRQYLVLYNHQTVLDPFFVGIAFHTPLYYLATEDLFSNGLISSIIRYLVAPIPIRKQTVDVGAVINCMHVAKEGGSIAIAPEGNRTYSGKTEYINPAIAALVQKLKLPVAIYRLEGGYGVQPRWSNVIRHGYMRGYISSVIEPEEYRAMATDELVHRICDELNVNEASVDGTFTHNRLAEYLERAIYVCPDCGLSVFESHRDIIRCTKCSKEVRYLPTKELAGVGFDFPFRFVNDWYEYQKAFVNRLNPDEFLTEPMYRDTVNIYEVTPGVKKHLLRKKEQVSLYGDRIEWNDGTVLAFDKISAVSVLGRNKLNIYHDQTIFQFKGSKRLNALKYVNIYHRRKNLQKGDMYGEFLGL